MKIRTAVLEDFDKIFELEKENFDEDIAFDMKKLLSFFKINQKMFYALVDDNDSVCAFTLISPIKKSASCKFENGTSLDLAEIQLDEIITDIEEKKNISEGIKMDYYLGDIVSSKDFNPAYLFSFVKSMISIFIDNVNVLYSTPVSNEGKGLLELMGFSKIKNNNSDLHSNYKLDVVKLRECIDNDGVYKRGLISNILKRKRS